MMAVKLLFYIITLLIVLNETSAQFNLILNRYNLNKTNLIQQTTSKQLQKKQQPQVKFINQTIKNTNYYKCPNECSCQGLSIDCSNRRLTRVPLNIPYNVIKVELQGNKLVSIKNEDLSYLKNLKVLHLQENQIEFIEENSFENLISLERLRLNNNKLTYLESGLFANLKSLKRLDLSFNKIKSISKELFSSLTNLNNLQIDNNELKCLEKGSLDTLVKLDIFRIQNNKLECSCKTVWLSDWLKKHKNLAHDTKCYTYDKYKEYDLIELKQNDLNCGSHIETQCETEQLCPYTCTCENNIVDCKEKSLTEIPNSMIADTSVELHLKKNLITEIHSEAFARLKQLRLLDLSNNQIKKLHPDSFKGLKSLNTLILFRNEIKYLPPLFLSDSPNVQFLLLNANKLTCLSKDVFIGLGNLNLLSLFDNQLKTIPNGILEPLTSIQTIHLGRNPLVCDCKLRWLNEYFRSRPVERSGITCSQPKRLAKKNIGTIPTNKFRCHWPGFTNQSLASSHDDLCDQINECPTQCVCTGTVVDCKGKNLTDIPTNLPEVTTEILLQDNNIKEIKANGMFKRLRYLQRLDLRSNSIERIEDKAFEGADSLIDLFLNDNNLVDLKLESFIGLKSLKTLLLRTNKISYILNTTFDNLPSLRLLSLYDNKIKCIQQGSFDKLKSLSTLNLMSNPINCNCKVKWLKEWLRSSNVATGNPKCSTPENLKDQSITGLNEKDLVCRSSDNTECGVESNASLSVKSNGPVLLSQLTINTCPKNCTCSNNIIRCSHLNLKKIPEDINVNVKELYLDSNEISEISPVIKKLTNLIKLDLSFNKIRVVPSKIFETLYNLDTLILSFNNIQCIHVDSFTGLKKLRMLSLYGNDLSTLTDGTFSDMSSLSHVALGLNPFYCDCNLAWLSAYIKNDYVEPGIARCQGPSRLANKLLLTTPVYYFECKNDSTTPENKCDICYKNACANNSTCLAKPATNTYQCLCTPGYHGEKCEQSIDACYGQPCKNQGECTVLMEGRYKCECKKGWEGYHCEINIDDCRVNNCQNNATCIDRIGSYECLCSKGYHGLNCDQKIEWCSHIDYNPCLNNAKCIRIHETYKCECAPGFTGENCATNIDDCLDHKCQFGTCVDGIQNYTCKCKDGFSGQFCDIMNPIAMPLIGNQKQSIQKVEQAIGCEANDCQHGGICYKLAFNGHFESKTRCKCPLGYLGDKCQILNVVNLQYEDSYLELESPELDSHFNITFTFVTDAENGVLFYHGSKAKHHMAVELFKGRIKVSFDVGNTPSSTMFSYAKVNDKKEHTVEFIIQGQNFTMKLNDSNEQRSISNQGLMQYLNVGDEPLYVGGVPNSIKERISKQLSHVRNASSLRGCLSNLYINSELRNLKQTEYNHKISPGCTHLESCKLNEKKCFNGGTCKTIFSLNSDFSCECPKEFTGNTCEIPVRAPQLQQHRAEPLVNSFNSNGQKSSLLLKSDDIISVSHRPNVLKKCSHRILYDFYTDSKTGCKSKKKLRMIKCTGMCSNENTSNKLSQMPQFSFLIGTNRKSNQRSVSTIAPSTCCQPIKTRPKRIKLFCGDGSTILADIHLPKKCVCSLDLNCSF